MKLTTIKNNKQTFLPWRRRKRARPKPNKPRISRAALQPQPAKTLTPNLIIQKKKKRKENSLERVERQTLRKWARGKSVERWEKSWSMCLEASHHDAQKCRITGAPLRTRSSTSFFDFASFTDPPIEIYRYY